MRGFICNFVILSMLFMSLDGAADLVIKGQPHDGESGHVLIAYAVISPDIIPVHDADIGYCAHCYHNHVASIPAQVASITMTLTPGDRFVARSRHLRHLALAPPTPPPTA